MNFYKVSYYLQPLNNKFAFLIMNLMDLEFCKIIVVQLKVNKYKLIEKGKLIIIILRFFIFFFYSLKCTLKMCGQYHDSIQ